jgi:large repetitive protein
MPWSLMRRTSLHQHAFRCTALIGLLLGTCAAIATLSARAFQAVAETGRWEVLPSGDQPQLRHEHGYVKVGDRFFLVGGRGSDPVKPVEIFDPATGMWSSGAPPPLELHHFQAVEHDGKVYVAGAMTGPFPAEPPVPDVHIYDPAADRWSKGAEIPSDRRRGGAGVVIHEGLIYVVAGIRNGHTDGHVAWLDAFDPRTGTWRRLADAPRARDHFHAAVIDGKLYAAGGRRSSWATKQPFELTISEVDVYDFRTEQWSTLPPSANLPTPRAGCSVAVVNGRLLVIGGESGAQQPAHAEVEAYNPRTGGWTTLAPLTTGRHGMQAIVHDGRVYVAAGSRTRGANEINTQEVFTPPQESQAGGAVH